MQKNYLIMVVIIFLSAIATNGQELSTENAMDAFRNFPVWKDVEPSDSSSDSVLTVLGRWAWGPCQAVDVKGNYAYIGNGPTFQVLDISNPASPKIVGGYLTDGYVYNIKLSGNLAFVAIGKGLLILNLSDPVNPAKLSEVDIKGGPLSVAIEGNLAYVSCFVGMLYVLDISDVRSPKLRGGIPVGGQLPAALAAKDGYAYVGNPEYPDLALIDATDPDSLNRSFIHIGGWGVSAFLSDSLLFVGIRTFSGSYELKIFNVSNPASLKLLGQVAIGNEISAIAVNDLTAFAATVDGGIYAVDISDLLHPRLKGQFSQRVSANMGGTGIAVSGDNVFTAFFTGLLAVNITNLDSLRETSFFPTGGSAQKIDIRGHYAYVASGYSGLWILDISDAHNPVGVANISTGGFTADVEVGDSIVYLVNWPTQRKEASRGLWVIDVKDPYEPKILSHYTGIVRFSQSRAPNALAKFGNLIFMTQMPSADNDTTLEVINVDDPLRPRQIGIFRSAYRPHYVAIEDSIIYLATTNGGLRIIDVHNPANPIEISSILNLSFAVVPDSPFAFVLRDSIFAIDISNLRSPFVVGSAKLKYGVSNMDVTISENYIYWADGELGAVDISDPKNPKQTATFSGNGLGQGVTARGDTILFADRIIGVWILKNELVTSVNMHKKTPLQPKKLELFQNYPNPFNPNTTIRYQLPKAEHVAVGIYDLQGRLVETLVDGEKAAGRYSVTWHAVNQPSGVYFYRIRAGQFTATKKLLLVK